MWQWKDLKESVHETGRTLMIEPPREGVCQVLAVTLKILLQKQLHGQNLLLDRHLFGAVGLGLVMEQLVPEAEAAPALRTGKGAASAVQPTVPHEASLGGEAAVALGAGEGQLPRVQSLVGQQVPVAAEGLPAGGAGIAPLLGMEPLVYLQALLPAEAGTARGADKGPLLPVCRPVPEQLRPAAEGLSAVRTLVGHNGPLMLCLVGQQGRLAVEDPARGAACLEALGCVACPVSQQVSLDAEVEAALGAAGPGLPPVLLVGQEIEAVLEGFPAQRASKRSRFLFVESPVAAQGLLVPKAPPTPPADQELRFQASLGFHPPRRAPRDVSQVRDCHLTPVGAPFKGRAIWPRGFSVRGKGGAPASLTFLLDCLLLGASIPVSCRREGEERVRERTELRSRGHSGPPDSLRVLCWPGPERPSTRSDRRSALATQRGNCFPGSQGTGSPNREPLARDAGDCTERLSRAKHVRYL